MTQLLQEIDHFTERIRLFVSNADEVLQCNEGSSQHDDTVLVAFNEMMQFIYTNPQLLQIMANGHHVKGEILMTRQPTDDKGVTTYGGKFSGFIKTYYHDNSPGALNFRF